MFTGIVSYAQQDAQFTQYMYNTIVINPAYAGSRGVMSIFALHRTQWVGLDGAPVTNTFSINTPIENSKLGIGISLLNDKIGPINENNLSADISYTIHTSETFKLSFGIKATANVFNLDVNKLNPMDQGDPQFHNLDNVVSPNIGAGIYFHSEKTYVGFSVPNFLEKKLYDDNSVSVYKQKATYYLIAGHVFDLSPSVKFKPSILSKAVMGSPYEMDLSASFLFNEKFVLGASYRWNGTVSAMAGFKVSDKIYIGYGYDMETTKLANYNSGSHEIFLRFELLNNYKKVMSPRFF
jgi:type IX secretion system PorP/SprF family membrane protein